MGKTKISWAEHTWNPFTGCSKVSAGCDNCYAEAMALRFAGTTGWLKNDPFKPRMIKDRLKEPLNKRKSVLYFVGSMGDLFHHDFSDEFRDMVFDIIYKTPWHTYLLLTKRPGNMLEYFRRLRDKTGSGPHNLFPNLGLGVSVENQRALGRISTLKQTPAAMHFVSFEPLLERIEFYSREHLLMDWAIIGCESGSNRRPMEDDWVAELIFNHFYEKQIPVFYKQQYIDGKKVEMPGIGINGVVFDHMPEFILDRQRKGLAYFKEKDEVRKRIKSQIDRLLLSEDNKNYGPAGELMNLYTWEFLEPALNEFNLPDYIRSQGRIPSLVYTKGAISNMAEDCSINPYNNKSLQSLILTHKVANLPKGVLTDALKKGLPGQP